MSGSPGSRCVEQGRRIDRPLLQRDGAPSLSSRANVTKEVDEIGVTWVDPVETPKAIRHHVTVEVLRRRFALASALPTSWSRADSTTARRATAALPEAQVNPDPFRETGPRVCTSQLTLSGDLLAPSSSAEMAPISCCWS